MGIWVKYGLGLVGCEVLSGFGIRRCLLLIPFGKIGRARGGQDIMAAKIKRSEEINGDFTVETEPIEANGRDFLTRLIQNLDLSRSYRVREVYLGIKMEYHGWHLEINGHSKPTSRIDGK